VKKRRKRISDFKPSVWDHLAVAWFEEKDYPRILEILNYPENMSRSYERWRDVFENRYGGDKRTRRGLLVRVVVDPNKFLAFCAARSVKPDLRWLNIFVEAAIGQR